MSQNNNIQFPGIEKQETLPIIRKKGITQHFIRAPQLPVLFQNLEALGFPTNKSTNMKFTQHDLLKSLATENLLQKQITTQKKKTIFAIPTQTTQMENSILSSVNSKTQEELNQSSLLHNQSKIQDLNIFITNTNPIPVGKVLKWCNKDLLDKLIQKQKQKDYDDNKSQNRFILQKRQTQLRASSIKLKTQSDSIEKTPINKPQHLQSKYFKIQLPKGNKVDLKQLDTIEHSFPRQSYQNFKFGSQEVNFNRVYIKHSYPVFDQFKTTANELNIDQIFDKKQIQRLTQLQEKKLTESMTNQEELKLIKQSNKIHIMQQKNKNLGQMHSVSVKILEDIGKQNSKIEIILDKFTDQFKSTPLNRNASIFIADQ